MTTSAHPGSDEGGGFSIAFRGLAVELVLPVLEPENEPPAVAEIVATLRGSPLKTVNRAAIERALEQQRTAETPVRARIGEVPVPAKSEPPVAIVVSSDRLAAFAVPIARKAEAAATAAAADDELSDAPPVEQPPEIVSASELKRLLTAEGVTSNRLVDVIERFGEGAPIPDVVCVAQGTRPTPGIDARLEYHFDEQTTSAPTVREDGSVDHHASVNRRFVEEGEVLVTRHPPQPGTPGVDLTGKTTQPPAVKDVDLKSAAGDNTTIVDSTVVAAVAGRPVWAASGAVAVLPVFEVTGDVDYAVGNIDFPGDVNVRGDVKPGFHITARGTVTVRGLVESASITAGGDVTLTGVVGEHETFIEAGGNLTAAYLHTTEAHVAGSISVSGEILNSSLFATRVETSPKGRIVGGQITAQTEIDCGALGSREGRATRAYVASSERTAVIRARRTIYSGVLIQVGNARREIADEIEAASFWNAEGAIVSLAPNTDAEEAIAITTPEAVLDDAEPEAPAAAA